MKKMFSNSQQAQDYGRTASEKEIDNVIKAYVIYKEMFKSRMAKNYKTLADINEMSKIDENRQLCQECIEVSKLYEISK